jgi:EAL domain-containing protein (putative c-di-GMP-specific phosphodiesterase class I)
MELKSALGFTVVEEAIRQLARRFETQQTGARLYHTDTAQLGLLLNTCAGEIERCLDELAVASRAPIRFNEIPVHVDTRIGHVAFDQVVEAPDVYLQRAETALATAYETGHDCVAYSPAIKTATGETLAILGELKDALERGQLSLDYQPKIAIPTRDIYGAEALMRWNHPERGNIPPDEFIPRAEHSTLIHLITEFALEQAMGQLVRWQQDGINLPIAVNISARNLLQPGLTDLILRLLDRHGLSGDSLEPEVTEGALMIDMDRSVEVLAQLDEARIIISIDDFGTGYSSLKYLHQLPISLIKIDQSFARRLPDDKGAAHILEAAVMLAHKMGIRAVAEGVETEEVYDFLENVGCDMAQGFMISPPLPAADFARWYMQCNGIYRHAHE